MDGKKGRVTISPGIIKFKNLGKQKPGVLIKVIENLKSLTFYIKRLKKFTR